jgi:hypothetical protein
MGNIVRWSNLPGGNAVDVFSRYKFMEKLEELDLDALFRQ